MPEPKQSSNRAGLQALGGALLFSVLTAAAAVGFLIWRGKEERHMLDARSALCIKGDRKACDLLRSACLKRMGDSCAALATAELASGPVHDPGDAVELLSDACTYAQREACVQAGRLYLEGAVTKKNVDMARKLFDRGCTLGLHESCALAQTIPEAP